MRPVDGEVAGRYDGGRVERGLHELAHPPVLLRVGHRLLEGGDAVEEREPGGDLVVDRHGSDRLGSANIDALEPVIQPTTWSRSVPAAGTSATFLPRLRITIRSATS